MNSINKNVCLGNVQGVDTNTLPLCPKEVIGSDVMLIPWRCFALETTMARFSKALKNLTLVYKCTHWMN